MSDLCEPVTTAGRFLSSPAQRAKIFPTASSRKINPACRQRFFTNARPRKSDSENKTRVTTGGAASVMSASMSISPCNFFMSTLMAFMRKSFKHQPPSSRETSSSKPQTGRAQKILELDAWSFSGAWSLDFGIFISHRCAVHVLVINIACGRLAHRHEPLRAITRHPDHVASSNGMIIRVEAIDALPLQHQQSVFHNVRLDERQRRSRLVSENVHGHVERRLVGQQHLQPRVFIAKKRLSLHVSFVTDDDTRFLRARERLKLLLENQQPRSLVGVAKLKIHFRRNKCVTACGQFKYLATQPRAAFAGENVDRKSTR